METYRLKLFEKSLIQKYAVQHAKQYLNSNAVTISVGELIGPLHDEPCINSLMVTDDSERRDTMILTYLNWNVTDKAFPLREGAAIIDFYTFGPNEFAEPACNIQAEFDVTGLIAIRGDDGKTYWVREDIKQEIETATLPG